ncbi:MAG TPA: ABC transporter substrate-binding protein [Flavobacteriales bacterium]|nr:ABC transporter substrate-binding protein [Flavobacteriales bacterium]
MSGCADPEPAGSDRSDWYPLPNSHAHCFRILARGDERQLVVFGDAGAKDTLAIYRIGAKADRTLSTKGAVDLTVLDRIAVVSTTHLPYISALGRADAVVGAAHLSEVRDTAIVARIARGRTMEIGTADGLDRERLLSLAPQALLDYPFGRTGAATGEQGPARIEVTEYLEQDPLGRAEWIRFFGVLLGEEARADSLYRAIELRYITVRDMASILPQPPKVFFGSAWQGQWHVPPGNSYMARLIADAGGLYCYAGQNSDGNIALDLESVLSKARDAGHFGMVLAASGAVGVMDLAAGDQRIARLDAVKRGGFYLDSQHSDVFGMALLEPDQLLMDLRCIFHPRYCGNHRSKYAFAIDQ